MKTSKMAAGLLLGGLLSWAHAAPTFEFGGYFRSGAGTSSEGGKEVCFRLPSAIVWFRLGNECDTYADLVFRSTLGQVDGTTFKSTFRFSYGTQGLANWEQTSPSFREVFVEAQDIGAGLSMPALKGASLWAGKRFYKNVDVHMLDYGYWEPNQGVGAGLENVDVGVGKFSYALIRIGDFTGYGVNTSLGGFNPDILGGGSRTATVHDFRVEGIKTNPGGSVMLGLDLVRKNNHDGQTSYTVDTVQPIDIDNNPATPPINVVVRETRTFDNQPGKNGAGLTFRHRRDNLLGLGGFHDLVLQYARNAVTLKGVGIAGSTEERREWLLFNHWVMEPQGTPYTATLTAGLRHSDINGRQIREAWIGARPQVHINNIWSVMAEGGYQQVKPQGEATRTLAKLTLGSQFSMGRSVWSRPAIRFYGTYAKWNDAAAQAGPVVCTGRDCGRAVPVFDNKRSGLSYGVQVEGWF